MFALQEVSKDSFSHLNCAKEIKRLRLLNLIDDKKSVKTVKEKEAEVDERTFSANDAESCNKLLVQLDIKVRIGDISEIFRKIWLLITTMVHKIQGNIEKIR